MKLHWKPHEFAFLPPQERALMYAFIQHRVQEEEKQQKKMEAQRKHSRRSVPRRR